MIDSHLHLDDDKFGEEVAAVIERAEEAGVTAMVTAGVDLASSRAALALAERHAAVYAAVGFHPHEAATMQPEDTRELRRLADHPKVVAVGEIGLDYYRDHSPRETQRRVMQDQLDLAAELGFPVVVHNRKADRDIYAILSRWSEAAASSYQGRSLGMLHCFSEDLEAALRYIALGFCVSLAGPVTYPNAGKAWEVAGGVPLDRLLVETDSPYLPPQSRRGHRNEPAHVAAVVAQIASQRKLSPADVAAQTAHNAAALVFGAIDLRQEVVIGGQIEAL